MIKKKVVDIGRTDNKGIQPSFVRMIASCGSSGITVLKIVDYDDGELKYYDDGKGNIWAHSEGETRLRLYNEEGEQVKEVGNNYLDRDGNRVVNMQHCAFVLKRPDGVYHPQQGHYRAGLVTKTNEFDSALHDGKLVVEQLDDSVDFGQG